MAYLDFSLLTLFKVS